MDYQTLQYEVEGEVGLLTLNRPHAVNAVNRQMMDELLAFWSERQQDFVARVIVICGAGEKGFSSGLDLKDATDQETGFSSGELSAESIYTNQRNFSEIMRLMRTCPQPVVAAVHGYAMGAGLSFALASDVRLASPDAVFCAQYINIGLGGADLSSSFFMWRIVGWGRAAELCLTGDRITADEAYRIGLVNHVYERGELMVKARELAANLVSKSRLGLRLTKEALNAAAHGLSLDDALKMENRNQALMLTDGVLKMRTEGGPGLGI